MKAEHGVKSEINPDSSKSISPQARPSSKHSPAGSPNSQRYRSQTERPTSDPSSGNSSIKHANHK